MTRKGLRSGVLILLLIVSIVAGAGALSSGVMAANGSNGDGNDTRASAMAMDADSTVSGTIEPGDVDWYAVEMEAGQGIYGELTLTTANDENLRFDIYSPDGEIINEYPHDGMGADYQTWRMVAGNTAKGGTVAEQSGTYYIRVKGADDEATSYDLTITSVSLGEHDPNEQPAQATVLDVEESGTVSGVLAGYDRDTYAIELQKGETVTIDYEQSNGYGVYAYLAGPNASDATLNSYYKGEYAVASQQVGGPSEFNYTANESGTYYIRIVPYVEGSTLGTFTYTVSYEMSVSVSDGDDEDSGVDTNGDSDDSRANATVIDVGETVSSTLGSENDSDWYAIDLEKGQGFTAELTHINRENPSAELTFDLYAPDGERIGESPFDAPLNAYRTSPGSNVAYGGDVIEQSGTYYIRVQGIEGANYSLTTNTVPLDEYDPNEQPATATAIESGDTISATLTGYDRDVYAIEVQKGDTVTINFTQSEGFTIALYVADSTVPSPMHEDYFFEDGIAEIDPFNDAPATFTVNQTGTYYIKVVPYAEVSTATTFDQNVNYEMSVSVSSQSNNEDAADDTDDSDSNETETPEDDVDEELNQTSPDTEEPNQTSPDTEESNQTSPDTDEPNQTSPDTNADEKSNQTADEKGDQSTDSADDVTDETMDDDAAVSDEEATSREETDETVIDSAQSECSDEQQTATPESDCSEETTEDDADCEETND